MTKKSRTGLCAILLFLVTTAGVSLLCFLNDYARIDMLRNVVLSGMGCFAVLFILVQSTEKHLYEYDNEEHLLRFTGLYAVCLVLAAACSYLPSEGWPFLTVFVLLALFSNTLIGISAGGLLLAISVLFAGCGTEVFVLYFTCGMIGAGLFMRLNDRDKLIVPVLLSVTFLLVGETACVVIYANQTLKWELFLVPFMNVIINIVLLFILLKFFSNMVIYKYRDKYMEINDQECTLLVELKAYSKEEYYRAVHTAYFCDRIAKKLNLDVDAVKAGGYYHRIGVLQGEVSYEKTAELIKPYAFPPAARRLLTEYLTSGNSLKSKESAVLLLADTVISSVLQLIAEDSGKQIDYDALIEKIFWEKRESTVLVECNITMREFNNMKNIFKEEKLYYDFLR
ncbi:MAG: hypothetical protein J1E83_03675 [Lachnospiraceae bacterium]|nr:hypothetical protein [Lachnospiraceae bacterium]